MLGWMEAVETQEVTFLKTDLIFDNIPAEQLGKIKYKNYIECAIIKMIIDRFT